MSRFHYILTRAAYNPDLWTDDANRRRLELFAATTVSSLRAAREHLLNSSSERMAPRWVIALHPDDPYRRQRLDLALSSNLVVHPVHANTPAGAHTRPQAAAAAYRTPWLDHLITPNLPHLTTRIDDDDALATTTLTRLHHHLHLHPPTERHAYIFPRGHRIHDGHATLVRHDSNAWLSLYSPAGDLTTAVTYAHRKIRESVPVSIVDESPAWLWVRHPDTLSGWQHADDPLCPEITSEYAVDWAFLEKVTTKGTP